jgi:paraquat-inducible protein A
MGTSVAFAGAIPSAVPVTAPRLMECRDCGQMQILPPMPPGTRAVCLRCDAVLRRTWHDPLALPAALNLAALVLFAIAGTLTIMSVITAGQQRAANLVTGPAELEQYGMWELSLVVLITTFAAPLARVLCMLTILGGLRLRRPPAELRAIFAWVQWLRPWSMIEIYMLGVYVAYVRLGAIGQVDLGPAAYALIGLIGVLWLADLTLDAQAVWEAMEPPNRRRLAHIRGRRLAAACATANRWRIGCDTCGLVSRAAPGTSCPRCGYSLHHRKPWAIQRTWAFVIASIILYIPANIYPALTVIRLGAGQSSTILAGVRELIDTGLWPLAALVFFASIAVPVLKLVGLIFLLLTTQTGTGWRLHDRTVLYRIVDAIGRWSMIDIFMESILVALVQFGTVASVYPGRGALAFAGVVILTMLAARSFDPRLMWDKLPARAPADRAAA